jgi:hypothetical protein
MREWANRERRKSTTKREKKGTTSTFLTKRELWTARGGESAQAQSKERGEGSQARSEKRIPEQDSHQEGEVSARIFTLGSRRLRAVVRHVTTTTVPRPGRSTSQAQ